MKKLLVSACLLSACVAGFAGEKVEDRDGIYAFAGLYDYEFDIARQTPSDDSYGYGLGWFINKNFSVEGLYTNGDYTPSFSTVEAELESLSLDLLYNATQWGSFSTHPYFKFGVGKYNAKPNPWGGPLASTSIENDQYFKFGLGVQHFFGDHAFMRIGYDILDGRDDTQDDKLWYVNLGYFFGSTHKAAAPTPVKAPAAAPKDSDGDGVIDANDRCPGTPAGAKVDSYGCPLDSDGDGVYDYQDACPNTPAGAKVDEKGCQIQEKVVIDMRLNFDTNKYAIKPEMVSEIAKVAEFLRQFSNVEAEIQGHTDSVGAASYNQGLSERRAKSVVDYLVSNFGIDAARLSGVGYGETRPIADNATAEGRALNRRAEANLESK